MSRLYRSRIKGSSLLLLVAATLVAMIVAIISSPAGDAFAPVVADAWHQFVYWLTGLFT